MLVPVMRKRFPFFRQFDEPTCKSLLSAGKCEAQPAGKVMFHQGELADKMYVVLEGSVAVRVRDSALGNEPMVVATLREGCPFGELRVGYGPAGKYKRRSSCVCVGDAKFLAFPGEMVRAAVEGLLNGKYKKDVEKMLHVPYMKVTDMVITIHAGTELRGFLHHPRQRQADEILVRRIRHQGGRSATRDLPGGIGRVRGLHRDGLSTLGHQSAL